VKQLNNALIFGINYGGSVWRGKEGSLYAEYPIIDKLQIVVRDWSSGVYIVKWQGENGKVLVNKLIKV
jgi:hypothetical protein